ncbi:alpha/beta hydrolase [Krasilnikovia sp. M28-CT-15]|uniref:alpha/beta hydrolase n=1 Tax=Krasilnikovia sp. M28-CT-15 TaxID=3373540 RepID=UPI0038777810
MVTFADLQDADLKPLIAAAGTWEQFAGKQRKLEDRVKNDLAGPLRKAGWQGDAADAAIGRMTSLHDEFEVYAMKTRQLAMVLREAADEFQRCQLNLRAAVDAAVGLGLHVSADGQVAASYVPLSALSDQGALDAQRLAVQNAEIYSDLIKSILREAEHTDLTFRDLLRKLAPDAQGIGEFGWQHNTDAAREVAAQLGLSAASIPPDGKDPGQAAAWWKGLTADQRELMLAAYPAELGKLDGLPTVDRDHANRMALNELISDDINNYRDLNDSRHQRLVNLLDRLDDAQYQTGKPPLYLLGIDNQGIGHAVVAVGNPDTARNTAVLVPGVSTNLDGFGEQINRASAIQDAAQTIDNGDVAVVAWLDYKPPQLDDTVVTAAASSRAEDGAATLNQFTAGLRTSHDAGPSHMTAIGHSYGSVVVGNAASGGHHLGVDDIVTAGSPGMDVASAGQLEVGARHVWAGAATDDPVASPGTAVPYVGRDLQLGMAIAHDMEPHQPGFGGNVYHIDTQGHSGYWTPGSQSLQNQARVVAGMYGDTTLDYGKAP